VPDPLLTSLLSVLEAFRIALTRPAFANLLVVACGWILTQGTHAVTEALVMTGMAGRRHHEAFHRFFSRGTWQADHLGYWMFRRLEPFLREGPIRIAVDDSVASKKGPHVFGIGTHVDAVRSTRLHRVFCFGHCWVVLAVLLPVPFSRRTWVLPVLFRLYRNVKECSKHNAVYAKKTELAREMIDVFVSWVGARRVELTADSAFCNHTITHGLPSSVVLFGAMRPDAVLTELPEPRAEGSIGRPRKRGAPVPKPEVIAKDEKIPWEKCRAELYGRITTVHYKTLVAQWYRACGTRLLRIVIVATEQGRVPFRVFFCTDHTVDVARLLETYAGRWGIEVFFRDSKQLLGFADSSARIEAAVRRVAPFVGLLYTALVVWFLEGASHSLLATPPLRPWYRHKSDLSFADILRTAQRAMHGFDISDLLSDSEHLKKRQAQAPPLGDSGQRLAA
jgi:DDE superfamily endonuclease